MKKENKEKSENKTPIINQFREVINNIACVNIEDNKSINKSEKSEKNGEKEIT